MSNFKQRQQSNKRADNSSQQGNQFQDQEKNIFEFIIYNEYIIIIEEKKREKKR